MDGATARVPSYVFDLGKVFPEVVGSARCSTNTGVINKCGALVLAITYLLSGNKFPGTMGDLTPQEIMAELEQGAFVLKTTVSRLFEWAQSVALDPQITLDPEQMKAVPLRLEGPGHALKAYQRVAAGWAARRKGCTAALGCGVGKTSVATAAAMAARALGFIKEPRCVISAPVNAMGGWTKYISDLKTAFDVVDVVSVDSLHHLQALASNGGAIIFDEAHKLKNYGRDRTEMAHELRPRFEWSICLTGSFLHTGCEAVMSILDLACPGLSRFTDSLAFGHYFDAVIVKKIPGRGMRRSLGKPAQSNYEKFTNYLLRSTISLSFESPEVKAENPLPPQARFLVDTWEKPQWVKDLIAAEYDSAKMKDPTLTLDDFDKRCPILWGPDVPWQEYGAAMAFAEQHVREQQFIKEMSAFDQKTYNYPEDVQRLALDVQLRWKAIKTEKIADPTDEALEDYERRRKFLNAARKMTGLPSFSALFWDLRTEGNVDRVIRRSVVDKKVIFRYVYAPDSSAENPKPGVKIELIRQWLRENEDELLFVGGASSLTVDMLIRMCQEEGHEYRVIRGSVPAEDRQVFVDEFQAKKFRVFVVQQVAGSESITCTQATTSMLVDHDTSPVTYTQFLARTARTGQLFETEHHDFSFLEMQTERIHALRRGEEFDATIRRSMETKFEELVRLFQNPV